MDVEVKKLEDEVKEEFLAKKTRMRRDQGSTLQMRKCATIEGGILQEP